MTFHEYAKQFVKSPRTFSFDPKHIETLIDKLHQYMFAKDREGRFIYANSNFLTLMRVTREELIGKRDADFFPRQLSDGFERTDKEVWSTGDDWEGEESICFPGGSKRIVWCNKTPIREKDSGVAIGVVGIFVDVTQNHQRYAQEVTQRTNNLVHEILIPIQSISSNLENLIQFEKNELDLTKEDRVSALSVALSELHVLGMHSENMQRTLVGDEQQELVFRKTNIRAILVDCTEALRPAAELKNVTFRSISLRGIREFPRAELSRPDLTRAFKNVYHNAVKYSYSGRGLGSDSPYDRRWISTEVGDIQGERFYVEIQNYGVGIAPDEIAGIFDLGTRGRYSIDRHRTGSGIGLNQVKRIVGRHNGQVTIASEKRGGPWVTTVRVELPYKQADEVIRYEDDVEDALG